MWQAAMIMGGAGLLLGAGLAYVAVKVAVPPDERVTAVRNELPGANCGACGFPGCDGLASAIVKGEAAPTACTAGGPDVAGKIGKALGIEVAAVEPKVATVLCQGTADHVIRTYRYDGIADCRAAALMPGGGPKACGVACIGLGTCVAACTFGALSMDEERGLPVVDKSKCTACGLCVTACPKGVMAVVPQSQKVLVACRNTDRGPIVRKLCSVGCLACNLCVRTCQSAAVKMENNVAVIDPAACTACGLCAAKCAPKSIVLM